MRRLSFTSLLLVLALSASSARAEQVILLPPTGEAQEERLGEIEEALADAILAVGHQPMTEAGALAVPAGAEPPTTANEMRAVAEMQGAQWVVVSRVTPMRGQYRLYLRVGQAATPRVEEIEVVVLERNEAQRLRDVMGALLRPEGLGDDAVRLTGPEDGAAPPADSEEERRRAEAEGLAREEEERRRQEFLAREEERVAEAERRRQEAWDAREQYGQRAPFLVSLGVDLRPIVASQRVVVDGEDRGGGVLGGLSLRLGRSLESMPGFELRAALDLVTGASSAFAVTAGAVYLHSFWEEAPVFIGLGLEAGYYQFVTGNQVPAFVMRAAPTAAWRATEALYLEVAIVELQYITGNGGVATLGFSGRAGLRF